MYSLLWPVTSTRISSPSSCLDNPTLALILVASKRFLADLTWIAMRPWMVMVWAGPIPDGLASAERRLATRTCKGWRHEPWPHSPAAQFLGHLVQPKKRLCIAKVNCREDVLTGRLSACQPVLKPKTRPARLPIPSAESATKPSSHRDPKDRQIRRAMAGCPC